MGLASGGVGKKARSLWNDMAAATYLRGPGNRVAACFLCFRFQSCDIGTAVAVVVVELDGVV